MATPARGRNGILPVPVAATRKTSKPEMHGRQPPKSGALRLRLIIRRLAPGLTENEFWSALGEEWKLGSAKIDWAAYKPGKVSKDPSQPSTPSRAYLKVKEPQFLDELAAQVKQTPFQDAKNTTKDPCLLGPPSLEFALYTRVPGNRVRNDGRQGTIDQDQEFIDFLHSLTEPVTKPATDPAAADSKQEKTTTTPLVQYLKEKKAAKAKEAAAAKTAKAKEAKEAKAEKSGKTTIVLKNAPTSSEKARVTKATQDAVKAINKSVASMQGKDSAQKTDAKTSPTASAGKEGTTPPARPPRERGSAVVANRILQRDLGIVPKDTKSRGARASAASKDAEATPKGAAPASSASGLSATKSPSETPTTATSTPPTGPRSSKPPSAAAAKPSTVPAARPAKPPPQPTPGAKSAFLKHANASQGVTEELLRTVFEAFGQLTKCEIDKKKGFGYVGFTETEGLKNAMQASPVKVGNGQVVVLENKTRRAVPATAASMPPMSPTTASASTQPATEAAVASSGSIATAGTADGTATTAADSNDAVPSQSVPPRAPRGAHRGGSVFNRGRGAFAPGRGNFPVARGGPRGNFRGGRGGGRGAPAGIATSSATPNAQATTSNASSGAEKA